LYIIFLSSSQFVDREDGDDDEAQLCQSLSLQDKLVVELHSVPKNVRDVCGSGQKKIEKLRELLPGIFTEVTKIKTFFVC
jgi:phosphatidylinositol 3-kinase